MARFIRVRATHPQGCYRAGIFHGVKPQTYDKNDLTADQLRLLREENGRMLLVDDVDSLDAGAVVPGDQVPGSEEFVSHPQVEQAEAERQAAVEAQAVAEAARVDAEAERDAAVRDKEAVESDLAAVRGELASVTAQRDAAVAELEEARQAVAAAKPDARPKPRPKTKPKPVDGDTDAATPLDGDAA